MAITFNIEIKDVSRVNYELEKPVADSKDNLLIPSNKNINDIPEILLNGQSGLVIAKRSWIQVAGILKGMGIDRKDAIKTLAGTFPQWLTTIKGEEVVPLGKDNTKIIDLAKADMDFNLIRQSVIAFTTWASRNLKPDVWELRPAQPKPTTVPEKKEEEEAKAEVTTTTTATTAEKAEVKEMLLEIVKPTDDQSKRLAELQIISAFMDLCRDDSSNVEESLREMGQDIAEEMGKSIQDLMEEKGE